jgi:hypothetical protein
MSEKKDSDKDKKDQDYSRKVLKRERISSSKINEDKRKKEK